MTIATKCKQAVSVNKRTKSFITPCSLPAAVRAYIIKYETQKQIVVRK